MKMNKKTYPYHLTAAEESVLDILWNSKDPLTGQQIVEEAKKDESNSWQERSIFLFLNSLMDKKFIESVGFVRAGKTYARTFQPVLSRPEFYARLVNAALTDKELVAFKRALKALNKTDDETEN
jgi:predicted transcriptional regulator